MAAIDEDRDEIIRAVDRCLCVEAGAGTGKTTLLVTRILYIVVTGRARLRDIVAITFTEKAAGELKVKLYKKIDEWLAGRFEPYEEALRADFPGDCEDRLVEALVDLEQCQASTIHSFATSLLKTRPVEAGVDPGFTTADESQMFFLLRDAWDAWIRERLSGESELFGAAEMLGMKLGDFKKLAYDAYEQRDLFTLRFKGAKVPDNERLDELFAGLLAGLNDCSGRLNEEVLADPRVEGVMKKDKGLKFARNLGETCSGLDPDDGNRSALATYVSGFKLETVSERNWSKCPELLETHVAICDELGVLIDDFKHEVATGLAAAMLEFVEEVERAKRRAAVLDFDDLLIKARDMLQDDSSVREYFKRKFAYILVDEFQDTDPLQADIVFFLSEREGQSAGSWTEVELEPGKLFIVGDPKQAIYGFRRADIETYYAARKAMGEGSLRYISVNHRSVPRILEWVNETMTPAFDWPYEMAGQAEYIDLLAWDGSKDFSDEHVVLFHNEPPLVGKASGDGEAEGTEPPPAAGEKVKVEEMREKEAVFLARAIEDIVGKLQVRDGDAMRPAAYGDVAVLMRKFTALEPYEQALARSDIPYRTEGGKNFFSRQEVVDLRNLLVAIDNPYDGVAVLGALRSYCFAVADDELAAFVLDGGRLNYLFPGSGAGPVAEAFATLRELHEKRNERPVAATIEELLDETWARESLSVKGRAEQQLANLGKVLDAARSLEATYRMSLSDFAFWLQQMSSESIGAEESPSEEAGGDYVHILTVHKAKGLEFPIVILCGVSGKPPSKGTELLASHADKAVEFKVGTLKTSGFAAMSEQRAQASEAEETRLFYVAATRPRDALRLFAFKADSDAKVWFDGQLRGFADEPLADMDGAVYAEGLSDCDLVSLEPSHRLDAKPEEIDIPAIEAGWKESNERALSNGRKGKPARAATAGKEAPPETDRLWPEAPSGTDVGTALHTVMELVPLSATGEELADLVEAVTREAGLGDEVLEKTLEMAGNIIGSDVWRRASVGAPMREVPFCVDDGSRYMVGVMDLVFMEDGEVVVVDYKSDNVTEPAVAERMKHYEPQGRFYASAMERVLGRPVKEVIFYFAAPDVVRTLD